MPEPRLRIADLVAAGRLRAQEPDPDALEESLNLAERDLDAAAANRDRFAPWAETMLYEAGLRAARAIVMAAGYRISADRGHVTAIDAADALTDGRHHRIFVRLHRLPPAPPRVHVRDSGRAGRAGARDSPRRRDEADRHRPRTDKSGHVTHDISGGFRTRRSSGFGS